ncbi:FCP1-like phosphatase, phosphatase domain-containing protein [Allomyces macrogynus ATCC 38327]|uniref:RNA polymerase II subunit A C-terminal domain phosphatase n=1 Tax=Allomyces macrogynus (strain ATCC 38327) TaxID=578462 RepID=A0A0L0SHL7_ALLM3|nr:FCP1-like phosphatase, phosphatase domain-containing protein [Allomyces macrogynus ATCC 38327]|eukprot:KNE61952.1 FCP1-like phosphatase, phosphatase domain-containing protein [Allomyces macrogynus ATCC 38327]
MNETETVQLPPRFRAAQVRAILCPTGSTAQPNDPVLRIEHELPDTPANRAKYSPFFDAIDSGSNGAPALRVRDLIRSPHAGLLTVLTHEGQQVSASDALFKVTVECSHPVVFSGMCAVCSKDLTAVANSTVPAHISMAHDISGIKVSAATAEQLDRETSERLLRERRLSIILDLDQTLIHATADPGVGTWIDHESAKQSPDSSGTPRPAMATPLRDLYRFRLADDPHEYYLRLRPHLHEFLAGLSSLFEMHIYTMGSRPYANKVAAIIDPDKRYFSERILSRDESGSFHKKSLQRLFPCDQSMVVAIDDRGDVWGWADNVIRVHPYSYFLRTGDINAPLGARDTPPIPGSAPAPDAEKRRLPIPVRVVDDDKELKILLTKLQELHQEFYGGPNRDVRQILPRMKRQVLAGCELVFSGIIPRHVNELESDVWKLATSFGARCTSAVTKTTTHVVATRSGTAKVRQAHAQGTTVVTPGWLFTSIAYWKRLEEARFLVEHDDDDDDGGTHDTVSTVTQHTTELDIIDEGDDNDTDEELRRELAALDSADDILDGVDFDGLEEELDGWTDDEILDESFEDLSTLDDTRPDEEETMKEVGAEPRTPPSPPASKVLAVPPSTAPLRASPRPRSKLSAVAHISDTANDDNAEEVVVDDEDSPGTAMLRAKRKRPRAQLDPDDMPDTKRARRSPTPSDNGVAGGFADMQDSQDSQDDSLLLDLEAELDDVSDLGSY